MIPKPLFILGRKEKEEGKEELFYPKHCARQLVLIFYHSFKGDIIKPILHVRKQRFKYQSVCPRSQAGNKW